MKNLRHNPLLEKDLQHVDEQLLSMAKDAPGLVGLPLAAIATAPAKRLRAGLVIACGRLGSFAGEKHHIAATAVEAIHLATLIHDDIIDEAGARRGATTINASLGPKIAVFAGDYTLARALRMLGPVLDAGELSHVGDVLEDLCRGEISQHSLRFNTEATEDLYLEVVTQKTSSLTALSCWLGARLAGISQRLLDRLVDYGRFLGIAFQVADDIMDLMSTREKAGKPVLNDLRQGIYTLPVIHALSNDRDSRLLGLLNEGAGNDSVLYDAVRMIIELGGVDYARGVAATHAERAVQALSSIPCGPYRDLLAELAISAYERSS